MPFKKLKSSFFLLLRFGISFGILFYLFKKTDLEKIFSLWLRIDLTDYILALSCVITFQVLVALRWKIICQAWDFQEKLFFYLRNYLMGFSLNTIFPGIIAGDALRTYYLSKAGLHWKRASFSVVLDRALGLLGIMLILALSLPYYSDFLPPKIRLLFFSIVYPSLLAFLIFALAVTLFLREPLFNPLRFPLVFKPLSLGLLIQILFVFQFIFLGRSLGINIPLSQFFVIIPVISFLAALPLSISGLGVREGTLSYFLYLLHYPVEYGVSMGLLGYSLILISALPGILFYLKRKWN